MKYPETEKLRASRQARITIISFLNWLEEEGYWPHDYRKGEAMRGSADQIALRCLGIDEAMLEGERRRMLKEKP